MAGDSTRHYRTTEVQIVKGPTVPGPQYEGTALTGTNSIKTVKGTMVTRPPYS